MALIPWELLDKYAGGEIEAEDFADEVLLYARTFCKRGRAELPDWIGGSMANKTSKTKKRKRPNKPNPKRAAPNKPDTSGDVGSMPDDLAEELRNEIVDDFPSSHIPGRKDLNTLWERAEGNPQVVEALLRYAREVNERDPVQNAIALMISFINRNDGAEGVLEHAAALDRRRKANGKSVIENARAAGRAKVAEKSAEILRQLDGDSGGDS